MLPFYSRSVVWPAEKKCAIAIVWQYPDSRRSSRGAKPRSSASRVSATSATTDQARAAQSALTSSSLLDLARRAPSSRARADRCAQQLRPPKRRRRAYGLQQQQQHRSMRLRRCNSNSSNSRCRRPCSLNGAALNTRPLSPPLPHANAAVASSTADARTLNPRPLDCWRCRLTACSSNNNNTGSRRNSNSSNSRRRRPCSLNGAALALSAATARERGRRLPICARARVLNLRPLDHRLRSHPAVSSHGRKRMRARGNLTHAGLPYVVLEFDKNGILVDGLERETKRTAKDGGDGDGVLKYSRATRPFRGRIAQRARFASARLPARPSHTLAVSPLDGLHPTRMRAVQVDPRGTGGRHTSRSSSTRTSSEKDGGAVHKPACVRESNRPTRNWRPPYVALEFDKNEIRERRRRFSYPLLCPCAPRAAAQQRATARARYLARIDRPVELRDAQSWKDRYSHYRTLYTTTRAGMHSQYKK
ncbi:hypothetical protein DFH11DRAFT_1546703 [Phellopilus nigrolimitatus]|nr:hypothetical protein DFH11DRAFT_1546703 [Phellopilus nigrolimitatus]